MVTNADQSGIIIRSQWNFQQRPHFLRSNDERCWPVLQVKKQPDHLNSIQVTIDDVFCKLSMIRSSAAAAAQMRSVYNPAGENWNCFVFVFDRGILQECLEQEANTAWWAARKTQGVPCLDPRSTSTVSSLHCTFYIKITFKRGRRGVGGVTTLNLLKNNTWRDVGTISQVLTHLTAQLKVLTPSKSWISSTIIAMEAHIRAY